jgi:hypothetical protein
MSGKDTSFAPYTPIAKETKDGPAKFWIKSLDTGLQICAQFNPKELQIDRAVPWSPPGEAGKEDAKNKTGGVNLEFTGAKGRTLSVELLFDEYEENADDQFGKKGSVAAAVKDLETLASVRNPGKGKEDDRRPHWCVCSWGTALKSGDAARFQCVIESISTKYTIFDTAGNPLRATVTLKLTEADSVTVKKAPEKKPEAAKKPAGPPATGNKPAGGAPPPGGSAPPPAGAKK